MLVNQPYQFFYLAVEVPLSDAAGPHLQRASDSVAQAMDSSTVDYRSTPARSLNVHDTPTCDAGRFVCRTFPRLVKVENFYICSKSPGIGNKLNINFYLPPDAQSIGVNK